MKNRAAIGLLSALALILFTAATGALSTDRSDRSNPVLRIAASDDSTGDGNAEPRPGKKPTIQTAPYVESTATIREAMAPDAASSFFIPPAGSEHPGTIPWTMMIFTAVGLLSIIGAFLLWNRTLSVEVRRATAALNRHREKERELERRYREQLARSEADFRQLFETCPDGIILIDTIGAICAANPAFARILGYEDVGSLVGRLVQDITPPEWQSFTDRALERIRGGIPFYEVTEKEYLRRDGTRVPVSLLTWIIRDAAEKISGVGVFVRDITREKEMSAARVQWERQIRQTQKVEAIGTLAGGIAHDFNNILWGMIGFVELATDQIETDPALARASLERVLQAGERAKALVQQILRFSRQTEAGMAPLEIGAIVKEASKLLRASLPATIEMRLSINPGTGRIQADATQIHQVVMNLCTNAFQAMADGKGTLTVGLDSIFAETPIACRSLSLPPGRYVRLLVADTGGGIAPEDLERIFDPYFTTKGPGLGTGLGLAVSMGIVKAHRGGIQVDSAPGRGTAFRVFFPAIAAGADKPEAPVQPIVGGSESLLLVDDESLFAEMTRQMLEALGYRVACADSGPKALEIFYPGPERFDLVISDQTMPQMTGLELARKIHELRPDLPILLCTGFSEAVNPETRREAGIARILMKPVTRQEMAGAIREALDYGKAAHG